MKSVLEYKIEEIAKKLDEIYKTVGILQDSILQLNAILEATSTKMNERELLSTVTAEISERLDKFQAECSKECNLKDLCTRKVEKVSFKILQVMARDGVEEGLREIRKQIEAVEKYKEVCKDESCFKNALEVFGNLEKILERSIAEKQIDLGKKLMRDFSISEINEEVAEKLSSLSNPLRIKILKALAKGRKSYAEIERITSIKGGHLQFHLRNLIKANYVAQEGAQGKYMITNEGLKVLKLLCQLEK
ncbi:MAG: winged helix-turn-helix domain-containing protein [Archaeoglobaceae archaeon]|nr:winged helix-turn-helix domain-containing protein [Archaeoglobaceae archaeon]MDW8128695.1 winged helix-turn-helix domain-containing protein [Archaeoglobaceae archaeon]